jgi:hypothetical protein
MSLNDLVSVSIDSQTRTPSEQGFGEPLIAAYHTRWTSDLVREYASLDEMTSDGFQVTDKAYLIAAGVFNQSPRVPKLKIGRRTSVFTQVIELTPTIFTTGYTYNVDVNGLTATFTMGATQTLAAACTGIAAAINALAGAPTSASGGSGTKVVCTAAAGVLVNFENWVNPSAVDAMKLNNATADPGLQADLVAMGTEDSDWYMLLCDSQGKLEVEAGALYVASLTKMFIYNTSDSACYDGSSTTDIMYLLKGLSYPRTAGLFQWNHLLDWGGAAWAGSRLTTQPGSENWAFSTLVGVNVDANLPSGKANAIFAKNGNTYTTVANVNITTYGTTASGEYIDVTRGLDWLKATMQVNVFAVFLQNSKVPFTDLGAAKTLSEMTATLDTAVNVGLLSSNPAPTASVPRVSTVSAIDKKNRKLSGCLFQGELAGAINIVSITGSVTN